MSSPNLRASATEQTSEVWNHITRVSPSLARCNLCQKNLKPTQTFSTTQYWDHLRSHHKEAYATTEYYKAGNGIRHRKLPSAFKFTEDQRKVLEESFGRGQFPSDEEKTSIAQQLGVQESSVKNWFAQRRSKGRQRRSLGSQPNANTTAAGDAYDNEASLVEHAQHDVEMNEASAEQSTAKPEARGLNHAPLQGQMPFEVRLPNLLHSPPPLAPPQPAMPSTEATEDGIVELSGRAMILRLRQLYEKDHKVFLRAQNDISNALFKYEMADE